MLNAYCISGMGVDGRFFKNIKLENCNIHHVKWETPFHNEMLPAYAMRLSQQIDITKPFVLIGVSLGGMCSVEIAKKLHPVKTFVISSCKTSDQLPLKLRIWKYFAVYKLLTNKRFIRGAMLVKKQFGITTKEQEVKFLEMLKSSPKNYFRGAVHLIMTWKSSEVPANTIQIHGTKDLILPYRKIKNCDYTILGGSHFMVVDRGREISEIINNELKKTVIHPY